ncbi:SRPBCC family protein [Pseudoduganella plicata]|uniref:Polyketide cyclase n=1 Tax=Pseudoduganella plicata TaxID=321984 RepID=A0A4P7BBG8_9BURK|nr:SRPBCC family protein [Pseudoduganella plicata]QBQ35946.1 polyketide cyclase [Pseudoduganella plicata]GGY79271.1 potassium-transporting ATPase subunit F [Pseudoduganella plicata]
MLKKILLGLVVIATVLVALALTRPDTFEVRRSIAVNAPAAKIAGYLNDFHQWTVWSPWERLDPAMRRTYSGPPRGQGAVYAWSGNDKVGEGRMEIVDDGAPTRIVIKVDFVKPFASQAQTVFELTPQGSGTVVTWTMSGPTPFISKLVGLFASMDDMIGDDVDEGLRRLKAAAEGS